MTAGRITPVSMTAIGLLFVLLATLSVFQTSSAFTTTPIESGFSGLFEPKTGELTLHQAPYCTPFDFFCFLFSFLISIFQSIFGGIFGGSGLFGGAGLSATGAGASGSSASAAGNSSGVQVLGTTTVSNAADCASGRDGRQCRRDARAAAREARQADRAAARAARR